MIYHRFIISAVVVVCSASLHSNAGVRNAAKGQDPGQKGGMSEVPHRSKTLRDFMLRHGR
jgi:hypothetical protein